MKLPLASSANQSVINKTGKSANKFNLRNLVKFSACLLLGLGIAIEAPMFADPYPTDADHFPHRDYPPTYPVVLDKLFDFTSDPNLPALIFNDTFRELENIRQNNAFRTVIRDMWDMQTSGSPRIRTRDLASPFTTQLSCYSSYYRSSGIEVPENFSADCPSTLEFTEFVKETPVAVEPAPVRSAPVRRSAPVPALW